MKFLSIILMCLTLASCSSYPDGTSVWGGGLFILPILTALGSGLCFWKAYKSSTSNSRTEEETGLGKPQIIHDNTGNVPIYTLGWFWFGVILAVATIVIIIAVNSDK
jgi:hypothetical protein